MNTVYIDNLKNKIAKPTDTQNKKKELVPWDFNVADNSYQKEPWILKKGKESVTIETDIRNRGNFYHQKDK